MATNPHFDITMIGHFSKDWVVIDGQGRAASGGAVYYGCIPASRLGARVAVVTRLHPDDLPLLDELKQDGVHVFAAPAQETTSIENILASTNMEKRTCHFTGYAGPFRPEDIPDLPTRIYQLSPLIAGEVDLPLLKQLAERSPVALDVQGFTRFRQNGTLVYRPWPEMAEALRYVTYLKLDQTEAELLTGLTDLAAAARHLAVYGPREIIATETAGVTVLADGQLYRAPFTPRTRIGRTGRGDTCFASYLGLRLRFPPAEATRLAAVVTSRKQEAPGPWRGSLADISPGPG